MSDDLSVILGTGPVGRELATRLHREGRRVRVATRSGRAEEVGGAEVLRADVSDRDDAVRACAGASVVYGCVGLDYRDWPRRWPALMDGMLAGAEAARARFVFMDNLYMYGPVDAPLREDMPLTDLGRKPATRSRITRMWQEAHDSGRVRAAAVRASDFYGPGVTASVLGDPTFGRIVRGKPALSFGSVDQPHSFSYVPDVARALMTVADAGDEAMGTAWHVPNAPDRTLREVLQRFATEVGRELTIRTPPPPLFTLLGLVNPNVRELREMLYQWRRPFRVDHSKFAARFWGDATPFEEGIPATAEWYLRARS